MGCHSRRDGPRLRYLRDRRPAVSERAADVSASETARAAIADELETTSAAVALAWLAARSQTVVPIVGARRLEHLEANLAGLDVNLTPAHLRVLDEVSTPRLSYPAEMNGETRAMLQFAGTTVDGETSTVYPPLLASDVRY